MQLVFFSGILRWKFEGNVTLSGFMQVGTDSLVQGSTVSTSHADILLLPFRAAHILWRMHRSVVQPGEELPSLPYCDHREGLQMEGRSHIATPADLLIDKTVRER